MNKKPNKHPGLIIERVTKVFGGTVKALDDVSLTVQGGELVSFLGPSGCGKTTMLNCIAGLEHPDQGLIRVGDFVMTDTSRQLNLQPEERGLGMVFQSYALWPHMSVAENIGFGLHIAKINRPEIKTRVEKILDLVGLGGMGSRYPFQLSGGQQQRVALARAVVTEPRLLLLDEPLSNLDAKVRENARLWLREIQKRLGITTVYVTHDQAEALAMSDQIAVILSGRVQQFGTPQTIYERPTSRFVADFIGATSFFKSKVISMNGSQATVQLLDNSILTSQCLPTNTPKKDDDVTVAIRSERIQVVKNNSHSNLITGRIISSDYLGAKWQHNVESNVGTIKIETLDYATGEVHLYLPEDALILLPD